MSTQSHHLTVKSGDLLGRCECGDTFHSTPEGFVAWRTHLEAVKLLQSIGIAAQAERKAREEVESTIKNLIKMGVPTRKISESIGTKANGVPFVSATVVQRIGREEHVESPRRRRRDK